MPHTPVPARVCVCSARVRTVMICGDTNASNCGCEGLRGLWLGLAEACDCWLVRQLHWGQLIGLGGAGFVVAVLATVRAMKLW